jgi:uncharacterized membrane protein YbhN (UPF0104 family)
MAQGLDFLAKLKLSLHLLWEALSQSNIPALLTLVIVYGFYLLFWETTGTRWVINRFNCDLSFSEMLPARAITFLLAIFNYQAGQLAIPLYLKRTHRVPLLEGTGSIVFIAAMDLFIVFFLGTLGSLFIQEGNLSKEILLAGSLAMAVYFLNGLFWKSERIAKPLLHFIHRLPLLKRFDPERSVFHAFRNARLKDYGILFLLRIPIVLAIFTTIYLLILCFHEHVDFLLVLIYMPVILIVATIPIINVGGVGATQALVVYFFKDYVPESVLFALALSWALGLNLFKVLVGAIFLNKHSTELFRPKNP